MSTGVDVNKVPQYKYGIVLRKRALLRLRVVEHRSNHQSLRATYLLNEGADAPKVSREHWELFKIERARKLSAGADAVGFFGRHLGWGGPEQPRHRR